MSRQEKIALIEALIKQERLDRANSIRLEGGCGDIDPPPRLSEDLALMEIFYDSLEGLTVMMELERALNIRLQDAEFTGAETCGELLDIIEKAEASTQRRAS